MLPHADQTIVEPEKILDYLLSPDHPKGRPKAAFFESFGFGRANWEVLKSALVKHATTHEVARTVQSPYGLRYIIEGGIETPDGRNPKIRTIWLASNEQPLPRLITAYPL